MTASSITSTPTVAAAERVPVRHERLIGCGVLLAGISMNTLTSQVHHHFAPTEAGGWRELPIYAIAGAIGWLAAFGIALVGPHRAANPGAVSRRVALGLALAGLPAAALLWWTPIPLCLGAAAVLLVRRARRLSLPSRSDGPVLVMSAIGMLAPIVVAVVRIVLSAR